MPVKSLEVKKLAVEDQRDAEGGEPHILIIASKPVDLSCLGNSSEYGPPLRPPTTVSSTGHLMMGSLS